MQSNIDNYFSSIYIITFISTHVHLIKPSYTSLRYIQRERERGPTHNCKAEINCGRFYILKMNSESPSRGSQRLIRVINFGTRGLCPYSFPLSSLSFSIRHFFIIPSFFLHRIKIISKVRFYLAGALPQGDAYIFLIYYISHNNLL